jgi:hypothetical protein
MNLKGFGKGSEGSSCGLIEVLSWHLPGRTEENSEKPFRIVGVLAEIQTEYFLNMSQEHYCYPKSCSIVRDPLQQ